MDRLRLCPFRSSINLTPNNANNSNANNGLLNVFQIMDLRWPRLVLVTPVWNTLSNMVDSVLLHFMPINSLRFF